MEKRKTITVEVSEEEYKDLEEFCKHHPGRATSPGVALKMMAGLGTYRKMKEKLDKKRKKPSALAYLPQDLGIPIWVPCALVEQLEAFGMSYEEYIRRVVDEAAKFLERALTGDKEAEEELKKLFKETGFERLGPYKVKVKK